jgi:uncharacterized linocin/CFP29 family protein
MSDFMMRDQAPLSEGIWRVVDEMVATVVSKSLVARRLLQLVGPLGWGTEVVPVTGFVKEGDAYVSADKAAYIPLQTVEARFMLRMKDLAKAAQTPFSLDLGAVATAAVDVARKEDALLIGGLIKAAGKGEMGDWSQINKPFEAVAKAEAALRSKGFDGPFALVLNYGTYAQLASLMSQGQRELKLVEKLVDGGIFRSPAVPEGQALLVDPAGWNVDMVVGQDIGTAFLGNDGLNLSFEIIETLALRIKRAGAAVLLS